MAIGNLINSFVNSTWNIEPQSLEVMRDVLLQKYMSGSLEEGSREDTEVNAKASIGVLNIEGTLVPKAYGLDAMCGMVGTVQLHNQYKQMVNSGYERIVLYIDSPGGVTTGIKEFAETIYQSRNVVETVAYIDNMAASAAYWLASACEQIVCAPTAIIGSIGTYAIIEKSNDLNNMHIFQAGTKKLYGSPYVEITEDEKEYFSKRVEETNNKFIEAVSKYRMVDFNSVKNLEADHFAAEDAPTWMYDHIGDLDFVLN